MRSSQISYVLWKSRIASFSKTSYRQVNIPFSKPGQTYLIRRMPKKQPDVTNNPALTKSFARYPTNNITKKVFQAGKTQTLPRKWRQMILSVLWLRKPTAKFAKLCSRSIRPILLHWPYAIAVSKTSKFCLGWNSSMLDFKWVPGKKRQTYRVKKSPISNTRSPNKNKVIRDPLVN